MKDNAPAKKILIVDDEPDILEFLQYNLKKEGYAVVSANDGKQAIEVAEREKPNLIILDINLPGMSGLEVLAELRARGATLPVLLLTARDTIADRISGLDAGADDYMVKPFDLGELTARLRAIVRRRGGRAEGVIRHGDLVFDPAARSVTVAGESVNLSARAVTILEALLERPGVPLSRERLEQALYGWGEGVESNAVEVHIHHLRKKLGKACIRTVRGLGYMIPKI